MRVIAEPLAPLKAKRSSLTPRERAAMLRSQGGICAVCGGPGPFDADHTDPVRLGNGEKPDRMICRARCHKVKTKADRKLIKRISHLRMESGQQARRARRKAEGKRSLLQTKPMGHGRKLSDSKFRKKMNGEVVPK